MNIENTEENYFSEMLKLQVLVEGMREITRDTFTAEEKKLIKELVIPEGVKTIAFRAFDGCKKIESITIPKSVTNIGEMAFRRCINLKKVTFEGRTYDEVKTMKHYPWGIIPKDFQWPQRLLNLTPQTNGNVEYIYNT